MREKRVEFLDANTRLIFFEMLKLQLKTQTWKEFREKTGIEKSRLEYYRNGKFTIPVQRFEVLLAILPANDQTFFREKIHYKEGNWGARLGGKKTAALYPEHYELARKVAIKKGKERALLKEQSINLNMPLSEGLCEFVGAIIGDGCVDGYLDKNGNSKFHVSIVGHRELDKDYLTSHLSKIGENIFGAKPLFYFRKVKHAMSLNFNSRAMFRVLTKRFGFPAGAKTFTVKIPEEIINSEEKFVFATVRGIFDTDGCIFFDKRKPYAKKYPSIRFETVSESLFFQLRDFLAGYFSLYAGKRNTRNVFFIEIYGHAQFEKWMKLIGFSNQKHLTRIKYGLVEKPLPGFAPGASTSFDKLCIPMLRSGLTEL